MEKANVYFTKEVSKESLVKMYEMLGVQLLDHIVIGDNEYTSIRGYLIAKKEGKS